MPNESDSRTERSNVREVIEFNCPLYVYKRRPRNQSDYLYTIAVWRGTMAASICIMQPLDKALAAFSELLRANGAQPSQTRNDDVAAACGTRPDAAASHEASDCSVNLRNNGQP